MTLEAPTPSVFYWKVIGVVQGLVLGWVLGGEGSQRKRQNQSISDFINQYQIYVSAKDKSQHIVDMTSEPSSGNEANRKVYESPPAGCVFVGKPLNLSEPPFTAM